MKTKAKTENRGNKRLANQIQNTLGVTYTMTKKNLSLGCEEWFNIGNQHDTPY